MRRESFDVFGLGQCCVDYIALVDSYPPPDAKCEFSKMVVEGGGPVATALVALSRWGVACAFAGVAGEDRFGVMIHKSLVQEGVDADGLLVRKKHESQFAFIVAEPGVGRRTVFWRRPTGPPPRPDEIDLTPLARAKVFHTDGLFIEAALAAAREAKLARVAVVVDAGSLREGMLDLARLSDYFIASEKFARQILGEDPASASDRRELVGDDRPSASDGREFVGRRPLGRDRAIDACRKMAELGPRVVGVTLGPKGYIALANGKAIEQPAYEADVVDTTGCGDVFHAGVSYGVVRGWDIEKSLDFAAWAAARVSTRPGGREGIPKKEEIASEGWHR
jgi:ribokinase